MSDSNLANGRDSRGKFAPGNPGGPGNPHVRRLAAYRQAVTNAISVEDLEALLRKVLEAAIAGDMQAARLILERTLGKPIDEDAVKPADISELFAGLVSVICDEVPTERQGQVVERLRRIAFARRLVEQN